MTKRTRYFMLGSVAILVIGLSIGLVGYYGGLPGVALGRQQGPSELRFVPKDAAVVAFANVRDVMASDFRARMRDLQPAGSAQEQQAFRDKTGIDIEQDIDHVVAAMVPVEDAAKPEKTGLVVATGRFDRGRIEALIREHGGQVSSYRNATVFTHEKPEESGGSPMALAFIGPTTVAFGGAEIVRQAIDLEQGGENITANAEMMRMIDTVDDGNAWAVGQFEAVARTAHLPDEVARQIPPISWFTATGRVNGGITGTVSVEANDEAAAKNLHDVINGFIALARLQAGSKPEVQAVVQSIQLSGGTPGSKAASLSFTVPSEVFEAIKPMLKDSQKHDVR